MAWYQSMKAARTTSSSVLPHLAAMSLDALQFSGSETHLDFVRLDGKSAKLRPRLELAVLADLQAKRWYGSVSRKLA